MWILRYQQFKGSKLCINSAMMHGDRQTQCRWVRIMKLAAVVCFCLLHLVAAVPVDSNSNKDTPCATNTYYIHEYHTHGNASQSEAAGLHHRVTSSDTPFKTHAARWTSAVENLEGELLIEKNKRIEQLTEFLKWMRIMSRSDVGDNNVINQRIEKILNEIESIVRGEKTNRKEKKKALTVLERPAFLNEEGERKEAFKLGLRSAEEDERNRVLKDSADGGGKDEGLAEAVHELQGQMKDMKKEMKGAKKQYLHLYKNHKRLTRKHQDLLQRHDRLKMYQADSIQRLVWQVTNETDLWRAGYRRIEAKLNCALDPDLAGCTAEESSHQIQVSSQRATNYREVKGRQPEVVNVEDVVMEKRDEVLKEGRVMENEESVRVGMSVKVDKAMQADGGLVEAGVQVSRWYLEQQRAERPKDCGDIDYWVQRESPVQTIYMRNKTLPVRVKCQEGWTIIYAYTFDSSTYEKRPPRGWNEYKYGFGALNSNVMWMGLEYLHWLSSQDDYYLQIDVIKAMDGYSVTASYAFFDVASEKDWYRLQVSDYSGSAGDLLGVSAYTPITGSPFSSFDRYANAPLGKLVNEYETGWWYSDSGRSFTRARNDLLPTPCFTNLLSEMPWFCDEEGRGEHVIHVTMKVMPSTKT